MAAKAVPITDKQRQQAQALAGLGLRDSDIAVVVELSEATLQRRCRAELTKGRAMANAKLAQALMATAIAGRNGAVMIFMAKVRLRWAEPRPTSDADSPDHQPKQLAIEPWTPPTPT